MSENAEEYAPTFLDLFCGCGGFTFGMMRAGLRCLAAIDLDPQAIATFRTNLVDRIHPSLPIAGHPLEKDLTTFRPAELALLIGTDCVDVIVGGPPCQGFSTARQADGANHGARLKADPRRHLYREFLRYVEFFQPRLFVMENVLGLRSAAGGEYFTRVQKESRALGRESGHLGYRVHGQVEDAWELGVPQRRRRQLIIGVRNDLAGYFPSEITPAPRARSRTLLGTAIGDLPILRAGGGQDERDYNLKRRKEHSRVQGAAARKYLSGVLEVKNADLLTNHVARPHSDRDLRDFALLKEGETSATAMRIRGVEFEFPYDKSSFKDRYTRQSRSRPCSTIVAHLSKDGLMFIHPTQNRSLTPREAARIQSFPDWFRFPARTPAFRLIGNAVPPLVSEAVGLAVKDFLKAAAKMETPPAPWLTRGLHISECNTVRIGNGARKNTKPYGEDPRVPESRAAAARALGRLAVLDRHHLRLLPISEFLRGWHALLFLFPGLHPDNALDHGHKTEKVLFDQLVLSNFEQLTTRRYIRTGWPVALELIGREAWRRYKAGKLSNGDFYFAAAQLAGLLHQQRILA